jgi:DHA1 family bicyclomycin/chloramphenicol resistance-like MFS transporter
VTLFGCVATVGMTVPTATTLALMHQGDAAGAGSALLGGTQYGIGGLAGPVVSLAGETAAAMSIAMAAFAGAGLAVYGATGLRSTPAEGAVPKDR